MDTSRMDTLEQRFAERRSSMMAEGHEGLFVAITESGEVGFFATEERARRMAFCAFGVVPMIVKRIEPYDRDTGH
jgi:hypothetical protein